MIDCVAVGTCRPLGGRSAYAAFDAGSASPFMTRGKIFGAGALSLGLLAFICIPRHLPADRTAVAAPSFTATLDNNQLTLAGSLGSDAQRTAVVIRAQELLKGSRVKIADQVAVSDGVQAAKWGPALPALLGVLTAMKGKGTIEVHDRVVAVTGTVSSADHKVKVLGEVQAAIGASYEIDDRLTVAHVPAEAMARPSRATIQSTLDELLRREPIAFESNSAALTKRGRSALDKIVPVLQRAPDLSVEVGGHTDPYGNPTYNQQLSQRRADAVRQYLMAQNVPNRVSAVGYGSSRPLTQERTRAAQQKNRRIELRVKEER